MVSGLVRYLFWPRVQRLADGSFCGYCEGLLRKIIEAMHSYNCDLSSPADPLAMYRYLAP